MRPEALMRNGSSEISLLDGQCVSTTVNQIDIIRNALETLQPMRNTQGQKISADTEMSSNVLLV